MIGCKLWNDILDPVAHYEANSHREEPWFERMEGPSAEHFDPPLGILTCLPHVSGQTSASYLVRSVDCTNYNE